MPDETLAQLDYDRLETSTTSLSGVLHCLRMLTEEADELLLPETAQALRVALTVYAAETSTPFRRAPGRAN